MGLPEPRRFHTSAYQMQWPRGRAVKPGALCNDIEINQMSPELLAGAREDIGGHFD